MKSVLCFYLAMRSGLCLYQFYVYTWPRGLSDVNNRPWGQSCANTLHQVATVPHYEVSYPEVSSMFTPGHQISTVFVPCHEVSFCQTWREKVCSARLVVQRTVLRRQGSRNAVKNRTTAVGEKTGRNLVHTAPIYSCHLKFLHV